VEARKSGYTHFLLLDDDIVWPNDDAAEPIRVYDKNCALTALPVVPSKGPGWMVNAQTIEYQMMIISKRAQFAFKNALMASGAAGVYRLVDFFQVIEKHDGEHVGDDLQYSYINHTLGKRLNFFSPAVVRTHPPYSLRAWWKQRARRWEASYIYNWRWVLGTIFSRENGGPGLWIRTVASYRVFVLLNDVARVLTLPFIIRDRPVVLLGVFALTYVSIALKLLTYRMSFGKYWHGFDRWYAVTVLTYPLYGFLTWLSRVAAIPRGISLVIQNQVLKSRQSLLSKFPLDTLKYERVEQVKEGVSA
jgi:cellulose synthase/poly-beta-1,6-N-acetylglucosamine synthase-like glycosyltransferase